MTARELFIGVLCADEVSAWTAEPPYTMTRITSQAAMAARRDRKLEEGMARRLE